MISPYPRVRGRRHHLMRALNTVSRDAPWSPVGVLGAVHTINLLLDLTTGGRLCVAVLDTHAIREAGSTLPVGAYSPTGALQLARREGTTDD